MRSHSSGIAEDLDLEFKEHGLRLNNVAGMVSDNSMQVESASATMKYDGENTSQRSGSMSSDGRNKRTIKSNIALREKEKQIKQSKCRLDTNLLCLFVENLKEGDEDIIAHIGNIEHINDEQAASIFSQLESEQSKKSYQAKKNWTEEESKLLLWAINKYCRGKKIQPQKLSKNDWIQIAGFIPGRNDS